MIKFYWNIFTNSTFPENFPYMNKQQQKVWGNHKKCLACLSVERKSGFSKFAVYMARVIFPIIIHYMCMCSVHIYMTCIVRKFLRAHITMEKIHRNVYEAKMEILWKYLFKYSLILSLTIFLCKYKFLTLPVIIHVQAKKSF